ncbi:MAG TPA: GDP-fucose synthetase [Thalassospira lucentensis]|uniref:GDP-L-fucose synthase n=1 Tax=Thalassospira lucentensis TaxID=168935 RepID=A0A3D5NAQ5_9PROT|nr:GDP-L-fucose synthase [Thalassospira lucentensis]HCW67728.1 GDP-fucose synthetase [Thalassospira lucentensis]|tara:strand:+ start:3046 stop:4005 length:960 start_codon:yes stop_codon:yes gene_type:complete
MTRKVFIAGHRGMVGSAIARQLGSESDVELILASRDELDLESQHAVNVFFENNNIDEVYLAAAKVGGIHANNTYPADFIYRNLLIETNVIGAAHNAGVQKLLFLGSSCIYPRAVAQPMREDALLTDVLESTNEPYAIAKIAGIKLCESFNRQYGRDYRSVMPTNLYGPGDNYHPENSHVIPALLRRFHETKISGADEVIVWGSGKPYREFLFVDDMAAASIHVMNLDDATYKANTEEMCSHINVGYGSDVSIGELATEIAKIVEFTGKIAFDASKPDGTMRKLMDSERLFATGWKPSVDLKAGLAIAYEDFLNGETREA